MEDELYIALAILHTSKSTIHRCSEAADKQVESRHYVMKLNNPIIIHFLHIAHKLEGVNHRSHIQVLEARGRH
jgi:hypothetical protein